MTHAAERPTELKNVGYELFIAGLSILSIVNMVLLVVFRDPSLDTVIGVINAVMMPIFLADFFYRFRTTTPRRDYVIGQFGWADLLSSLPFPNVKILRVFRLWRVLRLWRRFGASLIEEFVDSRAENALLTVAFLVLLVLEFGSLSVLYVETHTTSPNVTPNITNASDALWWTYVTITTVGYGDRFPTTNSGRIIALLVMTAGVGLFGTLSGFLANAFLSPKRKDKAEEAELQPVGVEPPSTGDAQAGLAELKRLVAAQEAALAELKASIDRVEAAL